MTFSIVAKCPKTGEFGVAAATAMPAVGKLVAYAAPLQGAIATQATVNPYYGIDGLAFLRQRLSAQDTLDRLTAADPGADLRQCAIIDAAGRTACWTGTGPADWKGCRPGEFYSLQGNRLAGPEVLEEAANAFESLPDEPLADRFLAALIAGVQAGGDTKGERSATIYVVDTEEYPLWDIRVDDHDDPIAELERLHDLFEKDFLPTIRRLPTRRNPAGEEGHDSA